MTKEEAIKLLLESKDSTIERSLQEWKEWDKKYFEAIDMAIKAFQEKKMTELKSCPFCGGEAQKFISPSGITVFTCKKCGADVYFIGAGKEPKAIEAWNRRANDEIISN